MMSHWATFKIGPSLFGCEILNKLRIVHWESSSASEALGALPGSRGLTFSAIATVHYNTFSEPAFANFSAPTMLGSPTISLIFVHRRQCTISELF